MSTNEEIAADLEQPLNRKDITAEIAGRTFDLDDEGEINIQQQQLTEIQQETHPLVSVMDMLICTSPKILTKYGYPAPEIAIWQEWGKPNINTALNQYLPMQGGGEGNAIPSPLIAAGVGGLALVLCFLPVILRFMDKKKQQEAEEKARAEPEPTAQPAGYTRPPTQVIITPQDLEITATVPEEPKQNITPQLALAIKNMESEAQPI